MSVSPSTVATDPLTLPEVKAFVRKVSKRKSKTVSSGELRELLESLELKPTDARHVLDTLRDKSITVKVEGDD